MPETPPRFSCNAVDTFDLFRLPAWLAAEQAAGRIAQSQRVAINVVHPDREMDGSCRWCGCRENEVVTVENGRIA